jgi:cobalamin synthase
MLRQFLLAVQFLTRLPVPKRLATTEEELGRAAAFFPLVGIIVGASAAGVYLLALRVVSVPVAVLLAIGFAAFIARRGALDVSSTVQMASLCAARRTGQTRREADHSFNSHRRYVHVSANTASLPLAHSTHCASRNDRRDFDFGSLL